MLAKKSGFESPEARPVRFGSDQVPLYYQLHNILADKISSGEFPVGSRIPTEAELVQEFGVSRITVRQGVAILEEQGLVRREPGRGTFVNAHPSFEHTLKLSGSLDDLISLGMATAVRVLSLARIKATAADAAILDLPPGSILVRCTRLRLHEGEPYSHVVNDLPLEIGRKFRRPDWKGSVSRVLEEKLGIPLREARQSIRASLADAGLARLLHTRIGAPLLSAERVVFTNTGQPVERVRTHYRSDIFSFNVLLRKEQFQQTWEFNKRPTFAGEVGTER